MFRRVVLLKPGTTMNASAKAPDAARKTQTTSRQGGTERPHREAYPHRRQPHSIIATSFEHVVATNPLRQEKSTLADGREF